MCRPTRSRSSTCFDLARPFSIESEHVDNISLAVSRRRLAELLPSMADFHGFVLRQGAMQQLLLAHLRACDAVAPRIGTAESQAVSDATLQLVVAGLPSARRQAAGATAHVGLASLTDMTDFIEAQLERADLGPDDLVEAFSLSRATLYRLFEPLGGVAAFILDRRLNRAQAGCSDVTRRAQAAAACLRSSAHARETGSGQRAARP